MATPAEHITIRDDVSDFTPEEYEADVDERFALSAHPDVQEITGRREDLKESTRQAFADAQRLRREADETEEKASAVAAGQADGDADELFQEAAEKEQKAERKEKEATAKAGALKQIVGAHDARMFLGKCPGVDNPRRIVDELDPVAQTRQDEMQMKAEGEVEAAAGEELANLLPELRERWASFAELYRKARLLADRSNGRFDAGTLTGGDVERAFEQMQAAVEE
jgi:hypothetical protein